MKRLRLFAVFMLAAFSLVCFLSIPVFSDDGDEDPWDADNDSGSEGVIDTTVDDSSAMDLLDYWSDDSGISDWLLGIGIGTPFPFVIGYWLNSYAGSDGQYSTQEAVGAANSMAAGIKGSPRGSVK